MLLTLCIFPQGIITMPSTEKKEPVKESHNTFKPLPQNLSLGFNISVSLLLSLMLVPGALLLLKNQLGY